MIKASLSTMWAIGRFSSMGEFAVTARDIGFCCVELNHQVTPALLAEFKSLHQHGDLRVSSVHDPCPNSSERLSALPQVSDLDEASRLRAVRTVERTMELAVSLGAVAVVLHVGEVTEMGAAARHLRQLFLDGGRLTDVYICKLSDFRQGFFAAQSPRLDAVARSLEILIPRAESLGLRLGVENRYFVHEIPDLSQARWLLSRFPSDRFGYWHDIGHAEVQARMGFAPATDWLQPLSSKMVGVHLHDVLTESITDHQAAGLGDANLSAVSTVLPSDALRVCEFDHRNSETQVRRGLAHLAALGFFGNSPAE